MTEQFFCGQTDSRLPTRAVRLMNEIPLQASQRQTSRDHFVHVCMCLRMHVTTRYNHRLFTKGVSGPGKPGSGCRMGKPLIRSLQAAIPHILF